MILNSNFNKERNFNFSSSREGNIMSTIKNLEKAQSILDQRFYNKQISNEEYIRKSKDIKSQIEKYQNNLNNF